MDDPGMPRGRDAVTPCPVADVMRTIHAQLQAGSTPTFDVLLAFGEPGRG